MKLLEAGGVGAHHDDFTTANPNATTSPRRPARITDDEADEAAARISAFDEIALPRSLTALEVRGNRLSQLDPIAFRACAPTLRYLGLASNHALRSTRGLAELASLARLNLAGCGFDDPEQLRPLAKNRALTRLDVSGSPLARQYGPRLRLMLLVFAPQLKEVTVRSRSSRSAASRAGGGET